MTKHERVLFRQLEEIATFGRGIVHFESIENGVHNIGYPDVAYFSTRHNGTIELKIVPSKDYLVPVFQDGQFSKNIRLRAVSPWVFLLMYAKHEQMFLLTNEWKMDYSYSDFNQEGGKAWATTSLLATVKNLLFKDWR